MATHSSTLAWKIPWTEEPGRLQSVGSQRVRHDWAISLSFFLSRHRGKALWELQSPLGPLWTTAHSCFSKAAVPSQMGSWSKWESRKAQNCRPGTSDQLCHYLPNLPGFFLSQNKSTVLALWFPHMSLKKRHLFGWHSLSCLLFSKIPRPAVSSHQAFLDSLHQPTASSLSSESMAPCLHWRACPDIDRIQVNRRTHDSCFPPLWDRFFCGLMFRVLGTTVSYRSPSFLLFQADG